MTNICIHLILYHVLESETSGNSTTHLLLLVLKDTAVDELVNKVVVQLLLLHYFIKFLISQLVEGLGFRINLVLKHLVSS